MLKRFSLRTVVLCLPFLLLAPAGRADTSFSVTGTLVNGSIISGTVNIDTGLGMVDAVDLTVTGAFNYTADMIGTAGKRAGFADYQIEAQDFFGVGASSIDLELPVASLVGYGGGSVCSVSNACPGGFVSDAQSPASGGPTSSFTGPASASSAPEPSTMLLMIGGGAILLLAKRRALIGR
jgi:hypothetical protein